MKKPITTLLILILSIGFVQSQGLKATSYVEKTFMNPKLGTSVGYEFNNILEVGGFYQHISQQPIASDQSRIITEEEFCGLYFAYPLVTSRYTNLKLNVRSGVSNGENFVITPSLLANFKPIPIINIGGGLGIRSFRPTLIASLSINLNNRHHEVEYVAVN